MSQIAAPSLQSLAKKHEYSASVIGAAFTDLYLVGMNEWPSKQGERRDVPIVEYHPGGNGINVAVALSKLGIGNVALFTSFMTGGNGRLLDRATKLANPRIRHLRAKSGIIPQRSGDEGESRRKLSHPLYVRNAGEARRVKKDSPHTGLAVIRQDVSGNPYFATYDGANSLLDLRFLRKNIAKIAKSSILYVGSIGNLPRLSIPDVAAFFRELRKKNSDITIILDVNLVSEELAEERDIVAQVSEALRYVDYFIPNVDEAFQYSHKRTPSPQNNTEPKLDIALALATKTYNRYVRIATIVKKGANGVTVYPRDGGHFNIPAFESIVQEHVKKNPKSVIDTVGAGDAWAAGFISSLLEKNDLRLACRIGNAVAARAILARGGTSNIPERKVILDWLRENTEDFDLS